VETIEIVLKIMEFNPGDRIKVIAGKYTGKTGEFKKHCTSVFPEWGYVKFDLGKRERGQKTVIIMKTEIVKQEI
jgi:hypothetical protein